MANNMSIDNMMKIFHEGKYDDTKPGKHFVHPMLLEAVGSSCVGYTKVFNRHVIQHRGEIDRSSGGCTAMHHSHTIFRILSSRPKDACKS